MNKNQESCPRCKASYADGFIAALDEMATLHEQGTTPEEIFHRLCTHWSVDLLHEYGDDPEPPIFRPDQATDEAL